MGKVFDVGRIWRDMGRDVRTVSIPQCRHLPREERPDEASAALLDAPKDWKGQARFP